jgi:hypothetical protein
VVKLIGPLHSDKASGTHAGTAIFSHTGPVAYARHYKRPRDPQSTLQLASRSTFTLLTQAWLTLSDADKATWSPAALAANTTPANEFLRHNTERIKHGQPWSEWFPGGPPYRIYSDAAVTPNLAYFQFVFSGAGERWLDGHDIWTTPNLTTLWLSTPQALAGRFCFRGFPVLSILWIQHASMTATPVLDGCPNMGNTLFGGLDLTDNALPEIDSIINAIAAACPPSRSAYLNFSGGTNAKPTAASAAAIAALTPPAGKWTLITNT